MPTCDDDEISSCDASSAQPAGPKNLRGADDPELFHLGLQGSSFHSQSGGGACGASDHPSGVSKGAEDMFAFCRFEGDWHHAFGSSRGVCSVIEFPDRGLKYPATSQDYGAFDE